jgi:hypothetical protein
VVGFFSMTIRVGGLGSFVVCLHYRLLILTNGRGVASTNKGWKEHMVVARTKLHHHHCCYLKFFNPSQALEVQYNWEVWEAIGEVISILFQVVCKNILGETY